jgi:hypothetical protein
MTRTVWTNEEKTAVFASMIDVFIEQPLTTNRTAMHHAQNVLVKDRRVKITDQRAHTYKARIEEARTTAKARVKNLPKPAPVVAEPAPPPQLRNDTDIGVLFAALVDRLVEQVLDKVEARMRTQVYDEVDNQFDAEYAKRNAEFRRASVEAEFRRASVDGGWLPDSCKKPRPYILVVGLLDSQASMVATQYRKQNVGMHFYTADEAKSRVIRQNLDAAFLMTKFISHAAQDRVRAVVPVVKLVNSGLHSLSQEIDRFLEGGT